MSNTRLPPCLDDLAPDTRSIDDRRERALLNAIALRQSARRTAGQGLWRRLTAWGQGPSQAPAHRPALSRSASPCA